MPQSNSRQGAPPKTLPPDFFDQAPSSQSVPQTLPPDFFDSQASPSSVPKTLPPDFFDKQDQKLKLPSGAQLVDSSAPALPPFPLPPGAELVPYSDASPQSNSGLAIPNANATIAKPRINMKTEPMPAPVRAYEGVSDTLGTLPQDIEGMYRATAGAGSELARGFQGAADNLFGVDSPAAREASRHDVTNVPRNILAAARAAYRSIVPAQNPNDPDAGYVKQGAGIVGNLAKLYLQGKAGGADSFIDNYRQAPAEKLPGRINSLSAALNASGSDLNFPETIRSVLPELDVTASRIGRPQNLSDLETIVGRTLGRLEAEFEQDHLSPNRTAVVHGEPIARAIESRITPEMEKTQPEMADALRNEANRYRQGYTLDELNDLRKRLNAENRSFYSRRPTDQAGDLRSRVNTISNITAANAARNLLYDEIESIAGRDIRPLKHVQGALEDLQPVIESRVRDLFNRASAAKGTANPLDRLAMHGYVSTSGMPHGYVGRFQELLRPGAIRELQAANKAVRSAFGGDLDLTNRISTDPLVRPASPTSTATTSSSAPSYPWLRTDPVPPAPYSGGGAIDVIGQPRASEIPLAGNKGVLRRPLGLLPSPRIDTFEPTPPSSFYFLERQRPAVSLLKPGQLRDELGSTAATLPSAITRPLIASGGSGADIAAAARQAQLGPQGASVPDRVFSSRVPHFIGETVRIRVKAPNGQTGTVPLNDLQKALAAGYSRIE